MKRSGLPTATMKQNAAMLRGPSRKNPGFRISCSILLSRHLWRVLAAQNKYSTKRNPFARSSLARPFHLRTCPQAHVPVCFTQHKYDHLKEQDVRANHNRLGFCRRAFCDRPPPFLGILLQIIALQSNSHMSLFFNRSRSRSR